MLVLVAYATKHGATQGIAERIGEVLHRAGHWMKEATEFVRCHQPELSERPTWLSSSGPLGTDATDAQGRDVPETAGPREVGELADALGAHEHRVFFGVLDPNRLGFAERAMRKLPAGRALIPEGDFREWAEIDQWATDIAHQLTFATLKPQQSGAGGPE